MSAVAHINQYKTGLFYTDEFRGDNSWNGYEHNVLFRNEGLDENGLPQFSNVAMALGTDDIKDSRGVATADFDNDGDMDIVVSTNPGDLKRAARVTPTLLRNNIGTSRNWLAIELQGVESNRDGIGAEVAIETAEGRQISHVTAGGAYASQQSMRLYFGLNEAIMVNKLTVSWPSGKTDQFEDISAKQLARITEGGGIEYFTLPSVDKQSMLSAR
ncbi:MAG TPA: CRTAC1 family protein [candidate division Zixibacteria bacterium]|jgi:hypothetical protein|nr:CRTAC1 family protein [candidate division Zixibacteria bacterium]